MERHYSSCDDLIDTGKGLLYNSLLKSKIKMSFEEFNILWSCFENECRNVCNNDIGYPAIVFCNGLGGVIMPVLLDDEEFDKEFDEENDEDD